MNARAHRLAATTSHRFNYFLPLMSLKNRSSTRSRFAHKLLPHGGAPFCRSNGSTNRCDAVQTKGGGDGDNGAVHIIRGRNLRAAKRAAFTFLSVYKVVYTYARTREGAGSKQVTNGTYSPSFRNWHVASCQKLTLGITRVTSP